MVRNICYIVITVLLFSGTKLLATEQDNSKEVFKTANGFYEDANYEEAIVLYKELLSQNHESAVLYFNLGNAHFKINEIPAAILYYEKALKLDPIDQDIKFNLNLAGKKTVDKVELLPELFIVKWWNALIYAKSSDSWGWLCLQALFLSLLLFILFLSTQKIVLKKLGFYGGIVFIIIAMTSFILGQQQNERINQQEYAIVFVPGVTVKSSPLDKGSKLFVIHEGTKVQVLESSGEWKKIVLANGNLGWVKANTLAII